MPAQILVIEDEEDLRTEIVEFLVRRRHQPVGCGSLAEAAAALETMTPDAVFSDINLPDGDGVSFCVKTAERYPGTLWLLMSGNDDLLRLGNELKSIGGEKLFLHRREARAAAPARPFHQRCPQRLRTRTRCGLKPVSHFSRLKGTSP